MDFRVVIIGGGIGGLTAAIRLARQGCRVTVLESSDAAGGLASGLSAEGFAFDGGPYVLLDRPGLQWALGRLGIDADIELGLRRISHVYEVGFDSGPPISIHDSLEQTAAAFESRWPGSAARYERFIRSTAAIYGRLQPMQWRSRPGVADVVRAGALRDLPFLIRSLDSVLKSSGLPEPILQTLGIWTHVAGQQPSMGLPRRPASSKKLTVLRMLSWQGEGLRRQVGGSGSRRSTLFNAGSGAGSPHNKPQHSRSPRVTGPPVPVRGRPYSRAGYSIPGGSR